MSQCLRDSVIPKIVRHIIRESFQLLAAISHADPDSRVCKHLPVVLIVAKGDAFAVPDAPFRQYLCSRPHFIDAGKHQVAALAVDPDAYAAPPKMGIERCKRLIATAQIATVGAAGLVYVRDAPYD